MRANGHAPGAGAGPTPAPVAAATTPAVPAASGAGAAGAPAPQQSALSSSDGTVLHVRRWDPAQPGDAARAAGGGVRPVLAFLHGFADHGGRYRLPATWFAARGHTCLAVDYRGHGKAGGERGHVLRFDEFLDDVATYLAHARSVAASLPGAPPVVLVGHSHGALLALLYGIERARDATPLMVVTSPFLGLAMKVPAWKAVPARLLSRLAPTFTLPTGISIEKLTRDAEVQRETMNDPLYGRVASARWFTEVLAAHERVLRRAGELAVPTLVLQAGDDQIADPGAVRRFCQLARAGVVEYHEYPAFRHEVFNEIGREQAYGDMERWLAGRLGFAASDAAAAQPAAAG